MHIQKEETFRLTGSLERSKDTVCIAKGALNLIRFSALLFIDI